MAGDNTPRRDQVFGAEQSVIGSMLIDSQVVGLAVSELTEDDFRLEACRVLFRAFRTLYLKNSVMDPVTVLASIGPRDETLRDYVMQLMEWTPTAAHISTYIQEVKAKSLFARQRNIGKAIAALEPGEDAMPLYMKGLALLSDQREGDEADMEQAILDFYEELKHEPEYLP